MKWSCRKQERLAAMAAYGELSAKDRERFERHLSECDGCRNAYERIQEMAGTLSGYGVPERNDAMRARSWAAISSRLQELQVVSRPRPVRAWRLSHRLAFSTLAALLLVALGVVIGRYALREPAATPPSGETASLAGVDSLSATQARHASEYLDRSKVLILGIMNNNPVSAASLQRQQRVSRELLTEARFLRAELNDPRQARLRILVEQLEAILTQITDMDAERAMSGVEVLRSGLDEGAILFKINVEQMHLDDWLRPSATEGAPGRTSVPG